MFELPLHPKLVHLPMALAVLLPLLTGGLLLARGRDWLPRRSWLLVVLAQALLVGGGWLSMQTGEQDEERVERVVPEAALEAHEEAAEVFVWAAGAVLVLSLVPLLAGRGRAARLTGLATLAGTLVVLVLGVRVGEAGGELVYRHGAGAAFTITADAGGAGPARPAARREEDDD